MLGQFTKLSQQQKLSPRQIQLMQLVQLPLTALEERIKEELEANPALEESDSGRIEEEEYNTAEPREKETEDNDDRYDFEEYVQAYIDDDPGSYQQRQGEDEEAYRPEAVQQQSFFEYLEQQLSSFNFADERERSIARHVIGSLDDDGYLARKISAISDDLLLYHDLDVRNSEIETVLKRIQELDPVGIGARDLQECLLIQLQRKIDDEDFQNDAQLADLILAHRIIDEYFEEFSKKHYDKIVDRMEADEDEVRDALKEILRLNPKPASGFSSRDGSDRAQVIVPDFFVFNNDGQLELQLNQRRRPALQVSVQYEKMLAEYKRKKEANTKRVDPAVQFIREKIDAAQWFIDAIQQRENTLLGVMTVLLEYQKDFFLTGDEKRLRPMILKDIAEPLELDISTISRVVNSKYVQTEYGTLLLKFFFSEGMTNEDGEEISTKEVKNTLREIIEAENKRKPLNDTKLQDLLKEKGYAIARRTVAKYREQLGMPVARLRKEL